MNSPERGPGGKFLPRNSAGVAPPPAIDPPMGPLPEPITDAGQTLPPPGVADKAIEKTNQEPPKRGRGRPRKDGSEARPRGERPRVNPHRTQQAATPHIHVSGENVAYRQTAEMLVSMVTSTCTTMLDPLMPPGAPSWKPEPAERAMLDTATETYLKATGMPDLPPGIVLLGVIAMYAMPRVMAMPQVMGLLKSRAPDA